MNLLDIKILLSSFLSLFFQLINYKVLNEKINIRISFKKLFFIAIIFWLIIFNNFYNTDIFKAPIAFLLIMIANKVMFNDPYIVVINTTTISYVLVVVCEIIMSIIFFKIGKFDMAYLENNSFLILLFTLCTNFVSFVFCRYFKFIKSVLTKINIHSSGKFYKYIIITMFLIILLIIDFRNIFTPSTVSYFVSILLVILVFIIFMSYLNDELKIMSELKKVDVLLENITNYEHIIDNNRMNSHEMLNNLILLKSFDDKNTKEYNNLLNELIESYSNGRKSIKNISLLPKGLKGIIYYKTHDLESKGINVTIDISKRVSNSLIKVDHNEFVILCRCVPILLDNAIEAALNSNDKNIIVSIYSEKNKIIISIENSCDNVIDIDFINKKNYSTKGENRGLGLYILNNLLSKSKKITFKQEYLNNYFISKLIIKK